MELVWWFDDKGLVSGFERFAWGVGVFGMEVGGSEVNR